MNCTEGPLKGSAEGLRRRITLHRLAFAEPVRPLEDRLRVTTTTCYSRRSVLLFAGAALASWRHACAQGSAKVRRIAYLSSRAVPKSLENDYLAAWLPRMRELGYLEGRDFTVTWHFGAGSDERLAALATEIVQAKPDLILALGTPAARAAQAATKTIPIVIAGVADPVAFGLVSSFAHPGGNITGPSIMATDVASKHLELLRNVVPAMARVAVIFNPRNPIGPVALQQVQAAAGMVGVTVLPFAADDPSQIDAAFVAISRLRADALIVGPDPFFTGQARRFTDAAAANRLPAIYSFTPFVEAGGLMCYGQNVYDNSRRAADYVDRIFKGAKPSELPIERPTRLELIVNRRAAQAIGLVLPQSILLRADRVIE
jgi:putative tryptophan/tyrosine transport system substrate-binding protein